MVEWKLGRFENGKSAAGKHLQDSAPSSCQPGGEGLAWASGRASAVQAN